MSGTGETAQLVAALLTATREPVATDAARMLVPGGSYDLRFGAERRASVTVFGPQHLPVAHAVFTASWSADARRVAQTIRAVLACQPPQDPQRREPFWFQLETLAHASPAVLLVPGSGWAQLGPFGAVRVVHQPPYTVLYARDAANTGCAALQFTGQWRARALPAVAMAAVTS